MDELIVQGEISDRIYTIRNKQVIIDRDLAELYGVETKYLKRQVQRNIERFNEDDFMFITTKEELVNLRSQFGTTNLAKTRALPYAFTEQIAYAISFPNLAFNFANFGGMTAIQYPCMEF